MALAVVHDFNQPVVDRPYGSANAALDDVFIESIGVKIEFILLIGFADGAFHDPYSFQVCSRCS
jgi:hypothetical protein